MGTRGLFGFYYKGKYYVVYNHFDSYPSGLGNSILEQIHQAQKDGSFANWVSQLLKLKVIQVHVPPTPEDIENLKAFTNLQVSNQSTQDWYCLVHRCQGNLQRVLNSGYLLPHDDNNGEPYFQEYAYVVNFDTNELDFYEGKEKASSYPLSKLPNSF
jgi:hypothetical protein